MSLDQLRNRVRSRVTEVQSRVGGGKLLGGQLLGGQKLLGGQLGNGSVINQVRSRLESVRPGLLKGQVRGGLLKGGGILSGGGLLGRGPAAKFRPGSTGFRREITDEFTGRIKDMAFESQPAKPADGRNMSVFVE